MSRQQLPPNATCPCGSGKEYGDCCHDKGFDWLVDEDGNIGKSVPVSDELAEVIKQQHRKFVEEFGREPGPEDNLFFNMPHQEVVEHVMVEGMKQAGLGTPGRPPPTALTAARALPGGLSTICWQSSVSHGILAIDHPT